MTRRTPPRLTRTSVLRQKLAAMLSILNLTLVACGTEESRTAETRTEAAQAAPASFSFTDDEQAAIRQLRATGLSANQVGIPLVQVTRIQCKESGNPNHPKCTRLPELEAHFGIESAEKKEKALEAAKQARSAALNEQLKCWPREKFPPPDLTACFGPPVSQLDTSSLADEAANWRVLWYPHGLTVLIKDGEVSLSLNAAARRMAADFADDGRACRILEGATEAQLRLCEGEIASRIEAVSGGHRFVTLQRMSRTYLLIDDELVITR